MRSLTQCVPTDPRSRSGGAGRILAEWHGLVPYPRALELQESRHAARVAGRCPDTLLLLEHPPVVTLGRGSALAHDAVPRAAMEARGIAVYQTGRGGRATYHGPGQLVGYPIVDLRTFGSDVHAYLRALEAALVATAADFGLKASAREGLTGVWVGDRKLASIGIQIRRWVTLHGFALNVDMDLTPFGWIEPCGLRGLAVTSLALETGRSISLADARSSVIAHLNQALEALAAEPRA